MTSAPLRASDIERIELKDGSMRLSLLSLGAITQGWWQEDVPLILGYNTVAEYLSDPFFVGVIAGRVANRIGGARFVLEGKPYDVHANEGANTLHGGADGLARQNWQIVQTSANEATLTHTSPDGACGFPGSVRFSVQVTLQAPRLIYTFLAEPDRPTPISLAQHNYYTLGEAGGAKDIQLRMKARNLLHKDPEGVPTGEVVPATGPFDFTEFQDVNAAEALDHFYPFEQVDPVYDAPVAELKGASGRRLRIWSDQPGAQVYAGSGLNAPFAPGAGVCFEPSGYPNAVNLPMFPSMIYTPEKPYSQRLMLEISEPTK